MHARWLLSLFGFLLFPFVLFAQNTPPPVQVKVGEEDTIRPKNPNMPEIGFYKRSTIAEKVEPVPYTFVRESDVLWSKIIWREVDLKQKMNYPLYYPIQEMRDRKSLTQALYEAILDRTIFAYDPGPSFYSPGDEFVATMSIKQVLDIMRPIDSTMTTNAQGQTQMTLVRNDPRWREIKRLIIKEEWFFDSKRSVLEVRILGLCPVVESFDPNTNKLKREQAFWVYYPEARKVLTHTAVFNNKNDAQSISFDDLFFKRRFDSYIIRETNEYNNRSISSYKKGGIPNMLESERIQTDIFNTEHDLWEY